MLSKNSPLPLPLPVLLLRLRPSEERTLVYYVTSKRTNNTSAHSSLSFLSPLSPHSLSLSLPP